MDFCASALKIGYGMTATIGSDPPVPISICSQEMNRLAIGNVVQPERVTKDAELAMMASRRQRGRNAARVVLIESRWQLRGSLSRRMSTSLTRLFGAVTFDACNHMRRS